MGTRLVVVTIDTIVELFKDYLTENNIPADAKPVTLMLKPTEKGKLAVVVESEKIAQDAKPLVVHFDLRRVYAPTGSIV